jgi:hypothetical protein
MYLENSNSVIEYCVIMNNRAVIGAGGLELLKGNYEIKNCIFNNNGGIPACVTCVHSIVKFYRVIINRHISRTLDIAYSKLYIINSTISNNYEPYIEIINLALSEVTLINSIIWNNSKREFTITNVNGTFESKLNIAFSDIKGGEEQIRKSSVDSLYYNNNIDADPTFSNIANNDYRLNKNSPCIDKGTAYYQIGNSIILNLSKSEYNGLAPDIGAYESNFTQTGIGVSIFSEMKVNTYPNPFNFSISLEFELPNSSKVNLSIYSITGQKVYEIISGPLPAGKHHYLWKGNDILGKKVASGIYILRLSDGFKLLTKNIVFLK